MDASRQSREDVLRGLLGENGPQQGYHTSNFSQINACADAGETEVSPFRLPIEENSLIRGDRWTNASTEDRSSWSRNYTSLAYLRQIINRSLERATSTDRSASSSDRLFGICMYTRKHGSRLWSRLWSRSRRAVHASESALCRPYYLRDRPR